MEASQRSHLRKRDVFIAGLSLVAALAGGSKLTSITRYEHPSHGSHQRFVQLQDEQRKRCFPPITNPTLQLYCEGIITQQKELQSQPAYQAETHAQNTHRNYAFPASIGLFSITIAGMGYLLYGVRKNIYTPISQPETQ